MQHDLARRASSVVGTAYLAGVLLFVGAGCRPNQPTLGTEAEQPNAVDAQLVERDALPEPGTRITEVFSSDGAWEAYSIADSRYGETLHLRRVGGSVLLARHQAGPISFAPNSSMLLFGGVNDGGVGSLFIIELPPTTEPRQLTNIGLRAGTPEFWSDGVPMPDTMESVRWVQEEVVFQGRGTGWRVNTITGRVVRD